MSEDPTSTTAIWHDPEFTEDWARRDSFADMLALPRHMSAALVAQERPATAVVVDVGSGPGDYLAVFLDELPDARGIWTDASQPMLDTARGRLARFGDRLEFRLLDMAALGGSGLPAGVDAVVSSRALHHLDVAGLRRFYADAAALLAPGGWVVNLDHVGPEPQWDRRLRRLRPRFNPGGSEQPSHPHTYPLTSIDDHVGALRAAGLHDLDVPWRGFYTCLFMARKPEEQQ